MKLTMLLFLIGLLRVSAGNAYAQVNRVNLNVQDQTLEVAFEQIKKQTDLVFFFSNKDLDLSKKISASFVNADVEVVLKAILGEKYSFRIEDNLVVIRRAEDEKKDNIVLKGVVKDEEGIPLPGVTVMIKGTRLGVSTNKDGVFQIVLPRDTVTLVCSFVGMKTQEVVCKGRKEILVILTSDVKKMDEVVVTGYQSIKEKSMAGAYSKVLAKDLVMTGNETVEQMLQGKLPGVMVMNTSGLIGTRQKVRVRGTATLVGNAEPVWVVDGIIQEDPLPFQASALTDLSDNNIDMIKDFVGGAISWLNPSDIQDITVLKDASATAIYGVKAANGVIVITTKKGERGRLSLGYSGNFSFSDKLNYNKLELMNSQQRVDLSREAYERGARVEDADQGYAGLTYALQRGVISYDAFNKAVKELETVNEDWFDILYRTPFSHSHSVNFGGGTDNLTARASFGYSNNQNTARGNEQVAYRGNLNVGAIFWKKLFFNSSISGNHTETKAFASGVDPYGYAMGMSRAINCYDEYGDLHYYLKDGYRYNILNELENSGNENVQKSLNVNLSARWVVLEGLTVSVTFGMGSTSSFGQSWFTERSNAIASIRKYEFGAYTPLDSKFQQSPLPYGGTLSVVENRNFNYTCREQVEYVKNVGAHSFSVMAGVESRSTKYDGYSQTDYGYQPDRGKNFVDVPLQYKDNYLKSVPNSLARSKPQIVDRLSNYFSYYGTASYIYDQRYALNFSVRGDASNRFGENTKSRFQPVWSVGFRWNVSDEHWLEGQSLVNNLSLTGSFGYQANALENVSPDLIAKMLPADQITGEYKMTYVSLPNPDLKWEKTSTLNLGVNFSLFSSKLNGSFDYYYKNTTDLISSRTVPFENGVSSMSINSGDMTNSGWDLSFSVVPVRTRDFVWNLGFNTSRVYNKVKSKVEPTGKWEEATDGNLNKEGYPVSSFWAFRFKGLNPENGGPMFDLSQANTEAADLDVTQYMVWAGKLEPDLTAGINMSFRYKHLSLGANFYYSTGNQVFLDSPYKKNESMPGEFENASSQLVDRWRKPGDEKRTMIPSIPVGENCRKIFPFKNLTTGLFPYEAWGKSDIRVVDAWYLRCNNLTLSYMMPEKLISRFAKSVNFTFTVSNPFQIVSSDFEGRDSEVAKGSQPMSRNFSFGLNVSF